MCRTSNDEHCWQFLSGEHCLLNFFLCSVLFCVLEHRTEQPCSRTCVLFSFIPGIFNEHRTVLKADFDRTVWTPNRTEQFNLTEHRTARRPSGSTAHNFEKFRTGRISEQVNEYLLFGLCETLVQLTKNSCSI